MNILKADFYRVIRSQTFMVVVGIMTVCAILFGIISHQIQVGSMGDEMISTSSCLMDTMLVNIFGPILAASYLCSDFQNKTIHADILHGKNRSSIVVKKYLLFFGLVVFMLVPYVLVTIIGFATNMGFSQKVANSVDSVFMSILTDQSHHISEDGTLLKLIVVLVATLIVYMARMSLCILIGFWFKKPISVVGVGILVEFVLSLIGPMTSSSEKMREILTKTPFPIMRDVLNLRQSYGKIFEIILNNVLCIVIVILITNKLFKKMDIK